jgi:hypothetical protein
VTEMRKDPLVVIASGTITVVTTHSVSVARPAQYTIPSWDPSGAVYMLSSISTVVPGVPPATSLFVAKLCADGGGIAWKTLVPNPLWRTHL